tara:strand:- start:274 stop:837 length:564 start_codon:yes stop_codon:yes gene_type:complete
MKPNKNIAVETSFSPDGASYSVVHANTQDVAAELSKLTSDNGLVWYPLEYLINHGEYSNGTVGEVVMLYRNNKLVAYSFIESYEHRDDKVFYHNDQGYKHLGHVHFLTDSSVRGLGVASYVARELKNRILDPLLSRNPDNSFILATGGAISPVLKAGFPANRLTTDYFQQSSFAEKVIEQWENDNAA